MRIEAMKQALEALQEWAAWTDHPPPKTTAAITTLRTAIEAAEKVEPVAWKPITTAPKTGRKVIVTYLNRNNLPRTVIARWLSDEEAAESDDDDVGLEGGWYECIDNWGEYTEVAIHEGEPTHWMPLPAAPGTTPPAGETK